MQISIVMFAIFVAMGLTAIAALETVTISSAEAKGCTPGFTGYNASLGRCFHP